MSTEKQFSEQQLEILHDHYKETFARILDVEKSRDRLFLWVIGLFALLSLEVGYPAAIGGSLKNISVAGGELDLAALPLPALLNITWALTLIIALQYCRTVVWLDRQYPYLHHLEETISPEVGGGNLYQREGKVYLDKYPPLLDVTWFAYAIFFPFIAIFAALGLVIWECRYLAYPLLHIVFDVSMAVALVGVFILYRVSPYVIAQLEKRKTPQPGDQSSTETPITPGQEPPIQQLDGE